VPLPGGHVAQLQGAKGVVQVHLQATRLAGQLMDLRPIAIRSAHIQGIVAACSGFGQLLELGERLSVHDRGIRVGHGTHKGHSAGQGGCSAAGEVLLVRGSRLPKMHMHIDEAGQLDDPPRGHAIRMRLHCRLAAVHPHRFHQQLGALNIGHQRNGVVHGQATGAVAMGHEGGDPATMMFSIIINF